LRGSNTDWDGIFITNTITDLHLIVGKSAVCVSPLYTTEEVLGQTIWKTNISEHQLQKLTKNLESKPTPLEVFDYCYGVLFDPKFREKYNEFLKRDFPRVPIIESEDQFSKYTKAGERLRKAHLMRTNEQLGLKLMSNEDIELRIEQVKYVDEKLFINKTTAIIGIPSDVYNYYIGGYQVIDKWFKSHKGETLTEDSFEHIKKVAAILKTTIEIQNELRDS
jgi:predicted helicase